MLNLVEILKNCHCPEGVKLWSPLFGIVTFYKINDSGDLPISVKCLDGQIRTFDKYGRYFSQYEEGKCVLFPSEKYLTWEGWKLSNFKVGDWITNGLCNIQISSIGYEKSLSCMMYYHNDNTVGGDVESIDKQYHLWTIKDAKDGDVLAADECYVIFKEIDGLNIKCYCTYHLGFHPSFHINTLQNKTAFKPATPKERTLLFKKMQEAGYQWYAGKKELKKIQPQLHYDISNFYVGMPVLVRDSNNSEWKYVIFSHYRKGGTFCAGGSYWYQCIPFKENKKLLGTTDMPSDKYISW